MKSPPLDKPAQTVEDEASDLIDDLVSIIDDIVEGFQVRLIPRHQLIVECARKWRDSHL